MNVAMILLEDTRNGIEKHDLKHKYFAEHGVEVRRTKLYVVPLYITVVFLSNKIFSWSFNIKLSKISRMNTQKNRRL